MEAHPKDMRVARPDNIVLDIIVFTTLFTLIVTGTLATIVQMDKDMIATESITKIAGSPSQSQTQGPSVLARWQGRPPMKRRGCQLEFQFVGNEKSHADFR
jgi:hypothetical protein